MLGPKTNTPGKDLVEDIVDSYVEVLPTLGKELLGYALAALALTLVWSLVVGRRRAAEPWVGERWLRLGLVLALIGVGLWCAVDGASCFDDAYISFRYAENLVAGEGLVYNPGEYVEGYTNFLWTMILSLFIWLTPVETPLLALLGCLISFAINLWVVWRISLKVAPPFHAKAFAFPISVALLAVQNVFTDYATTGLETAFASLMVNLGVLALVSRDDARATFWAGFCWIMATLTRPDHAIFYAVGSATVLLAWIGPCWRARRSGLGAIWREGLRPMATYAAPFLIWLGYAAWKLRYYGDLMPNTYYAKSADQAYYEQGWAYAADFHISSHLWIVIVALVLLWPWRSPTNVAGRRLMAFAVPSILLYEWYVARVGGDFMEGRFYVTLLPLFLLCAEQLVHELSLTRAQREASLAQLRAARRRRGAPTPAPAPGSGEGEDAAPAEAPAARRGPLAVGAFVMIAIMASTAFGVRLIPERRSLWYLTDEATFYPVVSWSPVVIDQPNFRVGQILGRVHDGLEARGFDQPIISSGAIGFIGYYSKMPVVDRLGLVDKTVAHRELPRRGRPGHEKWATPQYLRERGVHFRRGGGYARFFKNHARIRWGPRTGGRHWFTLVYDRELMNAIREVEPDVYFTDFEIYIDEYIGRLPATAPRKVRREWAVFKKFYFDHTKDPDRREAFKRYFAWVKAGNAPADLSKDGAWEVYEARAAAAKRRKGELAAARRERDRLTARWSLPWRQASLRREHGLDPAPRGPARGAR